MRHRRVRALGEIVVREGEEPPAPGELHVLEAARVGALDAHAVLGELDGAALRAPAAVERQQLLAIAPQDDRRRHVARDRLLPHELPEAGVAPVGRERTLHLDLACNTLAGRNRPAGGAQHDRVRAVAVGDDQDQVAGLGALESGGEHEERLHGAGVAERRPEALLELALRVEAGRLGHTLRGARGGGWQDDGGQLPGLESRLREDALHHLADHPAVAELRLEGAGEGARELLLPGPPGAEELVGDGVGGDDLGEAGIIPEQQRGARVAEVLLGRGVGLGEPAIARRHQHARGAAPRDGVEPGQHGGGAGAERVGEIEGANRGGQVEHGRDRRGRLLLAVRRRRRRKEDGIGCGAFAAERQRGVHRQREAVLVVVRHGLLAARRHTAPLLGDQLARKPVARHGGADGLDARHLRPPLGRARPRCRSASSRARPAPRPCVARGLAQAAAARRAWRTA